MAMYCEKHRAINTATSFLYMVAIGGKKKLYEENSGQQKHMSIS